MRELRRHRSWWEPTLAEELGDWATRTVLVIAIITFAVSGIYYVWASVEMAAEVSISAFIVVVATIALRVAVGLE